jgi:predicted house-cleaning noncanonical NTP pyrophosphatase (MazG superfamily)
MVEWLEARDHKPEFREISGDEYQGALQEKVVEEGLEVVEAKSRTEIVEELADLGEVITALRKHLDITNEEIIAVQERKIAERGTYEGGILLTGTWVPKGSKEHQYFLDRPEIECVDEE